MLRCFRLRELRRARLVFGKRSHQSCFGSVGLDLGCIACTPAFTGAKDGGVTKAMSGGPTHTWSEAESAERSAGLQQSEGSGG